MASGAKRQRYTLDEAVGIIFDDGSEHGGMDSGEVSELDRELENLSEGISEHSCDIQTHEAHGLKTV